MKRLLILVVLLSTLLGVSAQRTVQGIPYEIPQKMKLERGVSFSNSDPAPIAADESFTMDMIENWSGEGENEAAFVVQFNDEREENALVFGYRWDGEAFGVDLVKNIAANNPQLYCLIQYTGDYGYTICGIGWDADADGEISIKNTKTGVVLESENGVFVHPGSGYDYDDWVTTDPDDFWQAGWYNGYWSYWVKNSADANFGYSGVGASSRKLTNGCWDGWNFNVGMASYSWKPFVAAPSLIPEGAVSEFVVDGIYYKLSNFKNKTVEVKAPFELTREENTTDVDQELPVYSGEIAIPTTFIHDGVTYTVVSIGKEAFKNSNVTKITLPETVTKIGKEAFCGSTLSEINIHDAIKSIGAYAFANCPSITQLHVSPLMSEIPEGAFSATNITELNIPDNITSIASFAFMQCEKLEKVVVGKNVCEIGDGAFMLCGKLKEVEFGEKLSKIGESAFNNTAITAITIKKSVTEILADAFSECASLKTIKCLKVYPTKCDVKAFSETTYSDATLYVPMGYVEKYKSDSTWGQFINTEEEIIPVEAGDIFEYNKYTYKVISNSDDVREVEITYVVSPKNYDGQNQNRNYYQGEILIPEKVNFQDKEFTVTAIGDSAFYNTSKMTKIEISDKIKRIGKFAFYSNQLTEITLPESIEKIDNGAFCNASKLVSIQLPSNIKEIGDSVLMNCSSLVEVVVPESIIRVGKYAFSRCGVLETLTIPNSVSVIDDYAFYGCAKLQQPAMPTSLNKLGKYAFSGCKLFTSFVVPRAITEIPEGLFSGCSELVSVSIHNNVNVVGANVFKNCTKLLSAILPSNITILPDGLYSGCKSLPAITISSNATCIGSETFKDCIALPDIIIPENVTEIGEKAFYGCDNLVSMTIPENVTRLNDYVFAYCDNLEDVKISEKTTYIGKYAFCQNTKLKSINIPESVDSIGNSAFEKCSLIDFKIPKSLKHIGNYAFRDCTSLTEVDIPEGVTSINSNLFDGCSAITKVIGMKNVESIENYAFRNCASLDSIVLGPKTTKINVQAFEKCTSLKHIELGDSLKTINRYAFRDCSSLETLVIPKTIENISHGIISRTNENIVVWNCATKPYTIDDESFEVSDEKYAPIYVPFGTKSLYEMDANWGLSELRELSAAAWYIDNQVETTDCSATLSMSVSLDYTALGVVPERFRDANTKHYKSLLTTNIEYKKVNTEEVIALDAIVDNEIFKVELSDLEDNTTYDYRWMIKNGESVSVGDWNQFTTLKFEWPKLDYTNGIFFLNEDWFGHDYGSINFYSNEDEKIYYRAYREENPGEHLGITSKFAQIYGDKMYVMSKQDRTLGSETTSGGRLVVIDAKTMKKVASVDAVGEGDGRSFLGVDKSIGYVGTSAGIYTFNLIDNTVGELIEGTKPESGDLYSSQIGDMVRYQNNVFATLQGVGLLVIDAKLHKVVETIEIPDIVTVFVTSAGELYAASSDETAEFLKINAKDFTTEKVDIDNTLGKASVISTWGAWRSGSVAVDPELNSNTIYYVSDEYSNSIFKYDFDNNELTRDFIKLPTEETDADGNEVAQVIYGTGISINPVTREIVLTSTKEGWGKSFENNWIHFANPNDGLINKTLKLKDYYWFPAMSLYPDNEYPTFEIEPIDLIVESDKEGAFVTIDISNIATDGDNNDNLIIMSAQMEENDICRINNDAYGVYTLTALSNGEATLNVIANSNGHIFTKELAVKVSGFSSVDNIGIDDVNVYPNPATDVLNIVGCGQAILVSLDGKVVAEETLEGNTSINVSDIERGVYVLNIKMGTQSKNMKVILK